MWQKMLESGACFYQYGKEGTSNLSEALEVGGEGKKPSFRFSKAFEIGLSFWKQTCIT